MIDNVNVLCIIICHVYIYFGNKVYRQVIHMLKIFICALIPTNVINHSVWPKPIYVMSCFDITNKFNEFAVTFVIVWLFVPSCIEIVPFPPVL